jgi:hypothetical protein
MTAESQSRSPRMAEATAVIRREQLPVLTGLLRASADQIVEHLLTNPNAERGYTLGAVCESLAYSEGVEPAHAYAQQIAAKLSLHSFDEFEMWADLFKAGDKDALPKARRAAGIASEQLTFVEEVVGMELGGLHTAERLVKLVEAGDRESMNLARSTTKHVYTTERAALFGKLYRAGDEESLGLAIQSARDARDFIDQGNDNKQHYYRVETALEDMATCAINNGRFDDALKLIDAIESENIRAHLHVKLFHHGRSESLPIVVEYLAGLDQWGRPYFERELASVGYEPALQSVKKRANATRRRFGLRKAKQEDLDVRLRDLVVLNSAGDETAGKKIIDLVRSAEHPEYYLSYLEVANVNEATRLAGELYAKDPSVRNADNLVNYHFDAGLWQEVFNHRLQDGSGAFTAAVHDLRYLAWQVKQLTASVEAA